MVNSIGLVNIRKHRIIEEITKTNNKYYVGFACEVKIKSLPRTGKKIVLI